MPTKLVLYQCNICKKTSVRQNDAIMCEQEHERKDLDERFFPKSHPKDSVFQQHCVNCGKVLIGHSISDQQVIDYEISHCVDFGGKRCYTCRDTLKVNIMKVCGHNLNQIREDL